MRGNLSFILAAADLWNRNSKNHSRASIVRRAPSVKTGVRDTRAGIVLPCTTRRGHGDDERVLHGEASASDVPPAMLHRYGVEFAISVACFLSLE